MLTHPFADGSIFLVPAAFHFVPRMHLCQGRFSPVVLEVASVSPTAAGSKLYCASEGGFILQCRLFCTGIQPG